MVDTLVLGTSGEIRGSSSLPWGTKVLPTERGLDGKAADC